MKTLLQYFTFSSIGLMCTFMIIKSCSKFRFCLTKIRTFTTYTEKKKISVLVRITVKYPTLNFKCFTTGFSCKSVCIAYKVTNLTDPFPTRFRSSCYVNISSFSSNQVIFQSFTITKPYYWNILEKFLMFLVWC